MSFNNFGDAPLNYFPCRYGTSKITFRGPRRRLHGDYAVFLGGVETFGKFLPLPYPTLVEHSTGLKCVNLACPSIGIESYLNEPTVINVAQGARVAVIELIGAQNTSNRFYSVHPRRNDRFIKASDRLAEAFPSVDFTEFTFNRHLLLSLAEADPENFAAIEEELQAAWVGRMTRLIQTIDVPVVLVWLAERLPEDKILTDEPMFISREMIQVLPNILSVIEVAPTQAERQDGLNEMVFMDLEEPAAAELMGPAAHRRVAEQLATILAPLKTEGPPASEGPSDLGDG